MKKNTKGFTLIELLAVIVILAIIALIATPIVLNLIKKARQGAAQDSAYGIRKTAQLYYQTALIDNINSFEETTITFGENADGTGKIASATIGGTSVSDANDFKALKDMGFNIDGTVPTAGTLQITATGEVSTTTNLTINGWSCPIANSGSIKCTE